MRVYHSSSVRVEHPDLHDAGYHAILEAKYARIIEEISNMYSISLNEAMDMFYHSDTMQLMEEGVADLHCRSDKYLAEEVWRERNSQEV